MNTRNGCITCIMPSSRSSIMTRKVPMYILQTVVVCGVVCMCLSSTAGPGWWSWRRMRMSEDQGSARYRGPSALIHEQTVAVVTYNGPEDTIDRLARHFMKLIYNLINCRCRLILAESNDQFDKLDLLRHLTARMPVEQVSFRTMMSVVQICQDRQTVKQESKPSEGRNISSEQTPVNYWTLAKGILPGK